MVEKRYDVGYGTLDAFKRLCQDAARSTDANLARHSCKAVEWTRGESVFLVEYPDRFDAHVNEGLGTKNIVADKFANQCAIADVLLRECGRSYYDAIAQDAVAMIVNDMITLGALPRTIFMHLAVASADWFKWERRTIELIEGWKKACDLAGACWGGGETPALRDLIVSGSAILSGSANGIVEPKSRLIKRDIRHGDAIILLESSGIHANGLTFARDLAEQLPKGYLTKMENGRRFGEALLDPTHIYVKYVEDCLSNGIDIHYCVNITGHGWRKLMRAPEPFTYCIDAVPALSETFCFLQREGDVSMRNMLADFNCNAGFALIVAPEHVPKAMMLLRTGAYPFGGLVSGKVLASERREVVIFPYGERFEAEDLQVR